ncbi:MAG: cyclic nucleotide-binding domain-containing protein, partial [Chloroflexi bacterium]|nr:cyclic nucleotide-binding domain-containing protein [Chloroflexota bacterium]
RNGDLGRLEIGWLAANAGAYGFLVVTLVAAYEAGGAFAAGLLTVVRYVPPIVLASLAGVPTSRWRADRVLLAVNLVRAFAMMLTLVVIAASAPAGVLFLLVGIEAGFGGMTRPLHMSVLPWLARTPGELVASNIASSAAEGLGTLVGPALAGILLAISGPPGAAAAAAGLMVLAVVAVGSIRVSIIRSAQAPPSMVDGLSAGLRAARQTPAVRLVLLGLGLQTLVRGLLTVLLVVAAVELLGLGEPGVGTLQAAIGAGGFVGAVLSLSLTARTAFSPTFAMSLALWGLPIAAIGIVHNPALAVGLLGIVGMSNAILDVTGFTILQRATPNASRAAVMGLVDSVAAATAALGGLLASALLSGLGIEGALVATGAILPAAAALILPSLRRAEAASAGDGASAHLLQADPLLRLLSLSVMEELAAVVRPIRYGDGEALLREGEPGDDYLIVAAGEVEVSQGGRVLQRLGPGQGVGEVALLRRVPRTATVRAIGPVEACALDGDAFLSAIVGAANVRRVADEIVDRHLRRSESPPPL